MSNLISFEKRSELKGDFKRKIVRFYNDRSGHITRKELLDYVFAQKSKINTINFDPVKGVSRIPVSMNLEMSGMIETLIELADSTVEGGYSIFGHKFTHGRKKSSMPDLMSWQEINLRDFSISQYFLSSKNYIQFWKETGNLYTEVEINRSENNASIWFEPYKIWYSISQPLNYKNLLEEEGNITFKNRETFLKGIVQILKENQVPAENALDISDPGNTFVSWIEKFNLEDASNENT